jgi:c-di-GMP-related signal transduction protein
MADQAPFELLKTFSGAIHRRPLFITDRLDVDSYHLNFLDKQGEKLNNDSEVPELKEALLDHSGAVGSALRDVLNYEKGDWTAIETSPIPVEVLARAYLDAIHWAKELNTQLQD